MLLKSFKFDHCIPILKCIGNFKIDSSLVTCMLSYICYNLIFKISIFFLE